MKKVTVLLLIGLFLSTGLAYATETRTITMGEAGSYVKDDAGIFGYPQGLPSYNNLAIAEFGTGGISKMGFNWSGCSSTWGLYFSTDKWVDPWAPTIPIYDSATPQTGIDQKLDLFWAHTRKSTQMTRPKNPAPDSALSSVRH